MTPPPAKLFATVNKFFVLTRIGGLIGRWRSHVSPRQKNKYGGALQSVAWMLALTTFIGCSRNGASTAADDAWEFSEFTWQGRALDDSNRNIAWQPAVILYASQEDAIQGRAVTNEVYDAAHVLDQIAYQGWDLAGMDGNHYIVKRKEGKGRFSVIHIPKPK